MDSTRQFSSNLQLGLLLQGKRRKRVESAENAEAGVTSRAMETDEARKFAKKAARTRAMANETVQDSQKRLAPRRASYAKSRATESDEVASVMSHAISHRRSYYGSQARL